jgi:PAS domain S-box-containing protein
MKTKTELETFLRPSGTQSPEVDEDDHQKGTLQKVHHLEQQLHDCRQNLRESQEELRQLKEQLAACRGNVPVRLELVDSERNNELIARILETSLAAIVMINPQEHITLANSQEVKFMGLKQEEGAGRNSRDPGWVCTDSAGQTILKDDSLLVQVLADRRPVYQVPVALQHYDGRRIYFLVNGVPKFDQDGNLEGAVISAEDIIPLKQTEKSLNAAHARLEHLFMAGPAVIYSCTCHWDSSTSPSPSFVPEFLSANFAAKFGYTPDEVLGQADFWLNHLHPEDASRVFAENRHLLERGHHHYEYRFRHCNGSYLWVYDEKRLIRDAAGVPRELIGYLTDITQRKILEEELAAAKARLEHLISASSAVIYSCQAIPPYTPNFISENIKDILGYTRQEFFAHPDFWSENIHPEDAPRVFAAIAKLSSHKRLSVEYRFRSQSTDYIWMQDEKTLVDSGNGDPEIVGFWFDISKRKQTEQVLRETQEQLAKLIDSTPDPIFFKDTQGRYLMINQAYQKGAWFREKDWFGKTDLELFPPNIAKIFRKSDNAVIKERRSVIVEKCLTSPGGKKVFYQTIKFPLCDEQGLVKGIGGIARDITSRKEMEQVLQRSETNLQALFDSVQDFIWVIDNKGRFLRVNHIVLERLGYTPEELLGQSILTLHPPECQKQAAIILTDLLAGNADECPLPLKSKDGTQIPVETKITRGQWFGKDVFIGISRDITVRRQLESQLIKSAKVASLGVMAGGIAHEIRSPLTVCSSAAQFLLEDNLDSEFRRLCLEKMLSGIAQASAIVENLLKFARTPEKLEFTLITLQEVINDALALVANQARLQNVELQRDLPAEPISLYAMPGLLTQAFLNLFLNALKAMPDGGFLRIHLESNNQEAVITVADTGHGIAATDLPNIFDPFYTTQALGQGTGLGLAICQSFIKQHQGYIEVESNVGQGARFFVGLPLTQQAVSIGETLWQ